MFNITLIVNNNYYKLKGYGKMHPDFDREYL